MSAPGGGVGPTAFALPAVGGALYFLGHVGWGLWPCLLVSLAVLWWGLERANAASAATACVMGFVYGMVAYAGGFHSLWPLVDTFLAGRVGVGVVLWTAYGVWFALRFVVYVLLVRTMRRRGWSMTVAGVPTLAMLEWLHPEIFPVTMGAGLIRAPAWTYQSADLGGPLLLTALIAGANAVAFETWAWLRGARARPVAVWVVGVVSVLAVLAYGVVRIARIDEAVAAAPALRVGVVQANMDPRDASLAVVSHRRYLALTRELVAQGPLDLVVWPESAYGRGLRRPLPVSGRTVAADVSTPILFGGTSVVQEGGQRATYNSAFLIAADGMIRDAYDKNLLIPLAEQAPFPALASLVPAAGTYRAAVATPPLRLDGYRLATPICYEAIRPAFVRRMVRDTAPHLLVTLANDAYFGDSQEPWMHLHLARLRAVEHRRHLVRATNSGVSAVIDPVGRVVAASGLGIVATLRARVRLHESVTLYGRAGDWLGWVSLFGVVGSLVACVSGSRAALARALIVGSGASALRARPETAVLTRAARCVTRGTLVGRSATPDFSRVKKDAGIRDSGTVGPVLAL